MVIDLHWLPLIPLFEGVEDDLVVSWLAHRPKVSLRAGDPLIERDVQADQAFLLLAGELMVHLDPAPSYALGTITPGECVGEVSSLCGIPATAYVSAAADSMVCPVPRDELIDWARQSHRFSLNLITLMGRRLQSSNLRLSDEQRTREVLHTRSVTDPLTGVLNRGWITAETDAFQSLFATDAPPVSVLMIDIDHFKALNDSLGHSAGDQVLSGVAQCLSALVRSSDVLLRWGGEEFLIVCPATVDPMVVQRLAERLCAAVAERPFLSGQQPNPVRVTVSIGVAHRCGEEGWEALVERADQALYAAKEAGRQRVVVQPAPLPQA